MSKTGLERQKKATIAFELAKEIRVLLQQQNINFWYIAEKLYKLKEGNHHLSLGYDSFKDYASSNDLGMARSTIYAYVGIYEVYVVIHMVPPETLFDIPYDKLLMALSYARRITPEQMEEFIEKVRELSRSDLQLELADGKQSHEGIIEAPKTKIVKMFYHEQCHKYRVDDDFNNLCFCDAKQVYHFKDIIDILTKFKKEKRGFTHVLDLPEETFAATLKILRLKKDEQVK